MTVILYDLSDRNGQPVSPYTWRIREALHLLSIPFEARMLSLVEISRASFRGSHKTVPVLVDGDKDVCGSFGIADYLSANHDSEGRLFGKSGRNMAVFVNSWVDSIVLRNAHRMIVDDVVDRHLPEDRDYYRTSMEKRLGGKLADIQAGRESRRPDFQVALHPARVAIKDQPFLDGQLPTYADFALHSTFVWARAVSDFELLRPDDRLMSWIARMDDWLETTSARGQS